MPHRAEQIKTSIDLHWNPPRPQSMTAACAERMGILTVFRQTLPLSLRWVPASSSGLHCTDSPRANKRYRRSKCYFEIFLSYWIKSYFFIFPHVRVNEQSDFVDILISHSYIHIAISNALFYWDGVGQWSYQAFVRHESSRLALVFSMWFPK